MTNGIPLKKLSRNVRNLRQKREAGWSTNLWKQDIILKEREIDKRQNERTEVENRSEWSNLNTLWGYLLMSTA